MSKLSLHQPQQRQAVIAYLCGISYLEVGRRWQICEATVRNYVASSQNWNDSLVEHYRQALPTGRDRNAAHLYLASRGKVVEQGTLVDKTEDAPAITAVDETIFKPGIEQVINSTNLPTFLKPVNGFELLAHDLKPEAREPYALVERMLLEEMGPTYQRQEFSLRQVWEEVQYTLTAKIKYGAAAITPLKAAVLLQELHSLRDMQCHAIMRRYGLSEDDRPLPYWQVGELCGKSESMSKHIVAEARSILRQRSPVQLATDFITDGEFELRIAESRVAVEGKLWYKTLQPVFRRGFVEETARNAALRAEIDAWQSGKKGVLDTPIDDMDLSMRTYNCLRKTGLLTAGAIVEKSEGELLSTKNFGRKSMNEIKEVLERMGLGLRGT